MALIYSNDTTCGTKQWITKKKPSPVSVLRLFVFLGLLAIYFPGAYSTETKYRRLTRRANEETDAEVFSKQQMLGGNEQRKAARKAEKEAKRRKRLQKRLRKKQKKKEKREKNRNYSVITDMPNIMPTLSPSFSIMPSLQPSIFPTITPSILVTTHPTPESSEPMPSPLTRSPVTILPTPVSSEAMPSPDTGSPVMSSLSPAPSASPTFSPSTAITPSSVTPTVAPTSGGCLKFTWTDPTDPSVITWNNPATDYVELFEEVQEAWNDIKASLNAGIQNIKNAVNALAALVPDDITWSNFSFLDAGAAIYNAYQAVVAAVDAVKDIPDDVRTAAQELIAGIQAANLQDFLKIDVHPLTGKTLVLNIKKVCDEGPDEIEIYNDPQPLSSAKSFPSNPTVLGSYSPAFGTHSLPHTQTLTLNGNLGLQQYTVIYDGETYSPSRQVDGWTEEDTFLKIQERWADMQGPLGTMSTISTVVSQAIVTSVLIIDVIPNPGDILDAVKAPLSFIRVTLGNAVSIIRTMAKGEFKAIVKSAGTMIEALPEKDPLNANENTNSVANACIFPQYVP